MLKTKYEKQLAKQEYDAMEEKQPNTALRYARELRGWSQQTVAERLNTNEQVVCRWESGKHKPNRYFQTQLCQLFGKSAEELGFMKKEINGGPDTSSGKVTEQSFSSEQVQDSGLQEIFPSFAQVVPVTLVAPASEKEEIQLNVLQNLLLESVSGLASNVVFPEQMPFMMVQNKPIVTISEEFLSKSNEIMNICWQLYYSGGVSFVEQFLPTFLAQLVSFPQQPVKYHKPLAYVISQAYQLSCELATDQENYGRARDFGQQALLYAEHTENDHILVAALMRLANLYFHRKQSTYALRTYEQALPILKNVSPLLRGRMYAGVAEVYAMRNQQQDALSYLGLAHEHYPAKPEHDLAYHYTHITRYSLYVFGEGQTRLYLNQPRDAWENFTYVEKYILGSEIELLSHVDLLYYQAQASLMLGTLEASCHAIQTAVTLAKQANSRLYYNKILATYQEMRRKWQHESRVTELEDLFQPW